MAVNGESFLTSEKGEPDFSSFGNHKDPGPVLMHENSPNHLG